MTYDQYKLETPLHFAEEVKKPEKTQNDCYERIINHFEVIGHYDRKELVKGLKLILDYSLEPGNTITDVRDLITNIIDSL